MKKLEYFLMNLENALKSTDLECEFKLNTNSIDCKLDYKKLNLNITANSQECSIKEVLKFVGENLPNSW